MLVSCGAKKCINRLCVSGQCRDVNSLLMSSVDMANSCSSKSVIVWRLRDNKQCVT